MKNLPRTQNLTIALGSPTSGYFILDQRELMGDPITLPAEKPAFH